MQFPDAAGASMPCKDPSEDEESLPETEFGAAEALPLPRREAAASTPCMAAWQMNGSCIANAGQTHGCLS